jgi:hypothetical protein
MWADRPISGDRRTRQSEVVTDAPSDTMLEVSCTLTERELIRAILMGTFAARRSRRTFAFLGGGCLLLGLCVSWVLAVVVLVGDIVVILGTCWWKSRRNLARNPVRTYRFNEGGFSVRVGELTSTGPWSHWVKVVDRHGVIDLITAAGSYAIIPTRAFADPVDLALFRALVNRHIGLG